MTFIPGTTYDVFVTTGQPLNIVVEPYPNAFPPAIAGDFNLAIWVTDSRFSAPPPAGYQSLAFLSTDSHALWSAGTGSAGSGNSPFGVVDHGSNNQLYYIASVQGAAGDYLEGGALIDAHLGNQTVYGGGAGGNTTIWGGPNTSITAGAGNETIAGVPGDTITFSFASNVFINGSAGGQSISGHDFGNATIWGGSGDTIDMFAGGNVTVGGAPGDTIIGGSNPQSFIDGSQGHQSIVGGGLALHDQTIWSGAGDTITAGTGNVTIGGASGDTITGGSFDFANNTGGQEFIDASAGNQSILGGASGNETIWSGAGDTINLSGSAANVTVGGHSGDTIIGGTSTTVNIGFPPVTTVIGNEFIDGTAGNQSILGGTGGNETIWGSATDTIQGGSGGNETIAGVQHETIIGGAANTFFDTTAGNESIVAGGGNTTMWGGAHDTVQGTSGGTALIGFAGGSETFWDDGATTGRHDSISTFNQPGGDRVSLNSATDDPSTVAGTAATSGGNTTVTFHDGSTLTFIGISSVNSTFFTTH